MIRKQLTLTSYGSNKVVQNYNVMGIAKAALETSVNILVLIWKKKIRVTISASLMRTLSGAELLIQGIYLTIPKNCLKTKCRIK